MRPCIIILILFLGGCSTAAERPVIPNPDLQGHSCHSLFALLEYAGSRPRPDEYFIRQIVYERDRKQCKG